jgi:hypothetical protein
VGAFQIVELQGAGDGVEHRLGHVGTAAAFQTDVIVHADARQLGHLLTPQAGDPACAEARRETRGGRRNPGAARAQELP